MTTIVPITAVAPTLSAPFYRTRGDDWRGQQALAFQYGQYVPPVTNPDGFVTPATVIGYNITGWKPLGRFLSRPHPRMEPYNTGPPRTLYQIGPDCTPDNGFAALTDPVNGKFAILPDRTVTSQFMAQFFDTDPCDATLILSVKLFDNASPPNLGTITAVPIIVSYG